MTIQQEAQRTTALGSVELATLRRSLETDASRLRAELAAAETALVSDLHETVVAAGDLADRGALAGDLDANALFARHAREMLRQCERALDHISRDSYGLCDHCGRPIAAERLRALPRATLCVLCQRRSHP